MERSMEVIDKLIVRLRRMGLLLLIGLILIVYIALGLLYWQQGTKQEKLEEQIVSFNRVLAQPMGSDERLRAEYEAVNQALAPMTASAAITMLVDIAEKSGIDVSLEGGKFRVPSASFGQVRVGGTTFQLISFKNIHVQGDYDKVMAFISDLDSGATLKTMVLKRVSANEVEVVKPGDEARRAEFNQVKAAVTAMMTDNKLSKIPNPMSFVYGTATNSMSNFPDITTAAAEKGYTGTASPKGGYVLYGHDKISTDNTTLFNTTSYIELPNTKYYYTSEADGTVRQFDGVSVASATEHLNSEEFKTETKITVDVDIYIKPR